MNRWIARIRQVVEPILHYSGLPAELDPAAERTPMPDAVWLVMQEDEEGGFLLIRYGSDGEFAGDTWSPTREEALRVASKEYGLTEAEWLEVPDSESDPIAFAKRREA